MKEFKNYVSPHVHIQSLDSASTPEAFVERELELGTGAITVTDHGTLGACKRVYDLGKENGLIPILGLEAYHRDDDCEILTRHGYPKNDRGAFTTAPKYTHITLHAQDQAAYECMVRLLSDADERLEEALEKMEAADRRHGSERKPLFDWRDLEELGSYNITATSGCMIGIVARHLLQNNDLKTAQAYFERLKSTFKPGNLYTEVFPHDTSKNWVQGTFLRFADGTSQKYHDGKVLMTDVGEIKARKLADLYAKGDRSHKIFKAVKNYSTWEELPERELRHVEYVEGYEPNECFPYEALVTTPEGTRQIGTVANAVAAGKAVTVLSFNEMTREFEYKRVLSSKISPMKALVRVNCLGRTITCTHNHPILTSDGWIPAGDLVPGKKVIGLSAGGNTSGGRTWTTDQMSMLIGSYLGDGNMLTIGGRTYHRMGHGVAQRVYLEWKASILRCSSSVRLIEKNGFAGTPFFTARTAAFFPIGPLAAVTSPKSVTQDLADAIDWASVAIWYSDDGTTSQTGDRKPHGIFCTHSLSAAEIDILVLRLRQMGVECSRVRDRKWWIIKTTVAGFAFMSEMISHYTHPSMAYKLAENHRTNAGTAIWNGADSEIREFVVKKVTYGIRRNPATKLGKQIYDIEVEDNHNFIVSSSGSGRRRAGIVAHNCKPWAPDGDLQAGLNRAMLILAKRNGIKQIVSDDSHYARPEESVVQDVRLSQGGQSWRFFGDYSRKSSKDAYEHFKRTLGTSEAQFEEWVENSHEWAQKFKDFTFDSTPSLPTKFYEVKYQGHSWHKDGSKENSLRYLMELIKKHGRMDWSNKVYVDRVKAEIKLLHGNGTIDLLPYFFLIEDVCSFYTDLGKLTGAGRGSASGMLISYLLSITHVDPIKFGLSMERFLTLDRIAAMAMPDIDQDIPRKDRDLLINHENGWLKRTFGDHFAQISVDTKLKLKSAVLDVSRAKYGFVSPEIAAWTKKFELPPQGVDDFDFVMGYETDEGVVQGSIESDQALRQYISKYPDDWEIVKKCLGLSRQKSRHASAFLVANKPIKSFIPITTVGGVRVTAYTAGSVESVGGLKFDFLGLNTLSDISDAIELVQDRNGGRPESMTVNGRHVPGFRLLPVGGAYHDIWDLPEDQKVFADIALGHTETVFQFSTPSATQWLEHFAHKKPNGNYAIDSVYSMALFTALDRPGPLDYFVTSGDDPNKKHNMLVEYARRARGATPSPDILPIFDELLPETNGIMCTQEALQKVYQNLTGCSGSEAEAFRRDVAKKKKSKIEKAYGPFIERVGAKIGEDNAKEVFQAFASWSAYGFCAAHAVSYAATAYACAFLKRHYPLEWWTAVLRNADKKDVNEKFWRHCGHLIDLPDVKFSGPSFEIQEGKIRAPLSLLHGIGDVASAQLNQYTPYSDIYDFCRKIEQHKIAGGSWSTKTKELKKGPKTTEEFKRGHNSLHQGVVYTLIFSGAMDSLFPDDMHVGEMLTTYETAMAEAQNETEAMIATRRGSKPKTHKAKPVDDAVWNLGPVKRYQRKKGILPAYGQDLAPLLLLQGVTDLRGPVEAPTLSWINPRRGTMHQLNVVGAGELEKLSNTVLPEGQSILVAVAAYVDDVRVFNYQDGAREACELQLDVEGARFKYVRWGGENKLPAIFKEDIKGAVVIAVLNRWSADRPFSVDDLIIAQPPLGAVEEPKEEAEIADAAE